MNPAHEYAKIPLEVRAKSQKDLALKQGDKWFNKWADIIWEVPSKYPISALMALQSYVTLTMNAILSSNQPVSKISEIVERTFAELVTGVVSRSWGSPYWCVSKSMMEAVCHTTPPPEFNIDEEKLPFPAFFFLLEKGSLHSPDGSPIELVGIVESSPEVMENSLYGALPFEIAHKRRLIVVALSMTTLVTWFSKRPISDSGVVDMSEVLPYQCLDGGADTQQDNNFSHQLAGLAFTLVSLLHSRKHVEDGGKLRTIKKTGREVHAPRYLGRLYEIKRTTSDGKSGGSVAPHWRQGHKHTVSYGKGRLQKRSEWFEPIMVNG